MNNTMTTAQRFALNQWLSEYPEGMGYADILLHLEALGGLALYDDKQITAWELIEDYSGAYIAETIDNTRRAFEQATAE